MQYLEAAWSQIYGSVADNIYPLLWQSTDCACSTYQNIYFSWLDFANLCKINLLIMYVPHIIIGVYSSYYDVLIFKLAIAIFLRHWIYRMDLIDSSMIMYYYLWEIHYSETFILVESFILLSFAWSLRHCKSMALSMIHSQLLWFPSFTRNHDTHCTFNVDLKNFGY